MLYLTILLESGNVTIYFKQYVLNWDIKSAVRGSIKIF